MSLAELEQKITELSGDELKTFSAWFDEYLADQWDQKMKLDEKAGRFESVFESIESDIAAGKIQPL